MRPLGGQRALRPRLARATGPGDRERERRGPRTGSRKVDEGKGRGQRFGPAGPGSLWPRAPGCSWRDQASPRSVGPATTAAWAPNRRLSALGPPPFPLGPRGRRLSHASPGSRDPPMGDRAQRRGQPGSAGCGGRGGAGPGRESPRSPDRRQRGQRPGAERHGTERPRAPEPPGASLQAPPQRTAVVRPAPRRRVRVAQGPGQPPPDASRGGPASRSRRRRGRPGKLSPRHPQLGRRDPEVAPRCPDLPARRPHVSRSRRAGPLHLALGMWAHGLQGPELASARPGGGGPARA